MRDSKKLVGHLYAMFTILVWGSCFVLTKNLLAVGITAVQIIPLRMILAYVTLLVMRPRFMRLPLRDELMFILIGITQIMGLAEMNFLSGLTAEKRYEALEQLFRQQPPAVIVCRSEELAPFPEMQELAQKHAVALLRSNETTCTLMGSLISVLNLELAPRITRHGVLVEVYGEGILILGDSGVGKSETAIELVKRGHRLIADDAVELRKVSSSKIMGMAPENIRHFIELRGIGIINVARLFGIGAVKNSVEVEMVIELEAWDRTKNYDRTGLESNTYDILGVKVPSMLIPVMPGRNLAVILETAAINNRQKEMGYNAAQELLNRLGLQNDVSGF